MNSLNTRKGPTVIARLMGGLGNQLFEYAAARAVALRNNTEVKLDAISGFAYDYQYQRSLKLDSFSIKASYADRYESFCGWLGRPRRMAAKAVDRFRPLSDRRYVCESSDFSSAQLNSLRVVDTVYLDGLWQNESCFQDYKDSIRAELSFKNLLPDEVAALGSTIETCESVSVHVRRLFIPPGGSRPVPVEDDVEIPWLTRKPYYDAGLEVIGSSVTHPHFFVFSDYPEWARRNLRFPGKVTYVDERTGSNQDVVDLQLMAKCRHHIVSASTFSWWGAWLRGTGAGRIIAPRKGWAFEGMPLSSWTIL